LSPCRGGTIPLAEAALIAGIQNGTTYLNIRTVNFSGGEIRGQLEPVPEPTTLVLFGSTMAGLGLTARWSKLYLEGGPSASEQWPGAAVAPDS
jgi:hypothetical protein